MPLQVVVATEADAAHATELEDAAFGTGEINPVIFPGPFPSDAQAQRVNQLASKITEDRSCRFVKVVDTDLIDEAHGREGMVAFSCWYIWDSPRSEPLPSKKYGQGANRDACEAFFGGMSKLHWAAMGGKPHVYLKSLVTDPAHQRRGAGSMLLQWGQEQADKLGIPSWLEASPEGRRLYEKHGFQEQGLFVVDFSPWGGPRRHETCLMLRPVSSLSGSEGSHTDQGGSAAPK